VNSLRCSAAIEAQHPAEPLEALDRPGRRFVATIRLDQSVVEPLVIPLRVVMSGEISGRILERPFPEEDHSTETLVLDRPHKPLGVGIGLDRRMHPIQTLSNDVSG
jgi:hypothetical protein